MIGLVLLWVGAVLVLNGLWLAGRIGDREIAVINVFTGTVGFVAAIVTAVRNPDDIGAVSFGAFVLLFAFTYLWVAVNRFLQTDGRGLGWYSLFVAITAVPVGIETLLRAETPWGLWLAIDWLAWAVLWFCYFLLLVPRRIPLSFVAWLTVLEGILTAWLPGYLILMGHLRPVVA
jgi:hypothetical protein